jgi:hypothetical protein
MSRANNSSVVVSILFGTLAAGLPQTASPSTHADCEEAVHLTNEAEKRLGGALYEGPMQGMESMQGMSDETPEIAGAHEIHTAQHGGVFFMAPDKIHHIEARYSDKCGIQLLVYNAFTEPISVERFQALARIIPEDDAEWDKEVVRFLSPSAGGAVLQASGDSDIEGPYKIELYVKFPEADDAELFDIPVEQAAR